MILIVEFLTNVSSLSSRLLLLDALLAFVAVAVFVAVLVAAAGFAASRVKSCQ